MGIAARPNGVGGALLPVGRSAASDVVGGGGDGEFGGGVGNGCSGGNGPVGSGMGLPHFVCPPPEVAVAVLVMFCSAA